MADNLKDIAWQAARVVKGYDASRIRQDACGAWIAYTDFNKHESMFGWEIDHIYPVFKLRQLGVPERLWNTPLNILSIGKTIVVRALHILCISRQSLVMVTLIWNNKMSFGFPIPYRIVFGDFLKSRNN